MAKPVRFELNIAAGSAVRLCDAMHLLLLALEPLTDDEAKDVLRAAGLMFDVGSKARPPPGVKRHGL